MAAASASAAPTLVGEAGPLTLAEIERALKQIARWADHAHFDPYFCAGEMLAGFHRRLITELIDDSEGDRVFSQAHLQALLADLRARGLQHPPINLEVE